MQRAEDQTLFTRDDFISATGWTLSSIKTYMSKQWKEYIEKLDGDLRVKREFCRLSLTAFQHLATQSRKVFTEYNRAKYGQVVTYEFLLPLTRQGELRRSLDDLFYSDTIMRRVKEIGLPKFESEFLREQCETDEDYTDRIIAFASDHFDGYSMGQVSGRFRANELMIRQHAGNLIAEDKEYLIDEITANVRFIIPCMSSKVSYDEHSGSISEFVDASLEDVTIEAVTAEIKRIRSLFFHLFVEAVVRSIQGEEEIWLLENGATQRLFVWERASR